MIVTAATCAETAGLDAASAAAAPDGWWRVVTQPDHARLGFEILRLWRGPELAKHPRRDDVLFAAREHDNGWRELDAAPLWNAQATADGGLEPPGGRPHDFRSMPPAHRVELWPRGTSRFADSRPYGALLVTLHALAINQRGEEARSGPAMAERWDAMVGELEERRDALLEETGVPLAEALDDYRFVRLADTASLTALGVWGDGFRLTVPGGPAAGQAGDGGAGDGGAAGGDAADGNAGGGEDAEVARRGIEVRGSHRPPQAPGEPALLHLEPLPLAGATTFRVPARYLPRRDHGDDVGLAVALATARWAEYRVRVTAAPAP